MFCLVGQCCRCCSGGGRICARSMLSVGCGAVLMVVVVSVVLHGRCGCGGGSGGGRSLSVSCVGSSTVKSGRCWRARFVGVVEVVRRRLRGRCSIDGNGVGCRCCFLFLDLRCRPMCRCRLVGAVDDVVGWLLLVNALRYWAVVAVVVAVEVVVVVAGCGCR